MAGTDGAYHAAWIDDLLEIEEAVDLNLDSAATSHMVGAGFPYLRNIRDLFPPVDVEIADGFKMVSNLIADIKTRYIELHGVFVVKGLKMNLVSVRQLADADIFTTFLKKSAYLWMEGERERVGGAILDDDGLYKLRYFKPTRDAAAHTTSPAATSEHITSYFANASSIPMEYSVMGAKDRALGINWDKAAAVPKNFVTRFEDLVTSFEDPALRIDEDKIPADWVKNFEYFARTAKLDESDETGGAAHLGSDGTHGADFMRVQLNEHCLNA